MKLTKTMVDGAAPKASRYRLADSLVPGLCLVIYPSGAKTYYVRLRTIDGRQQDHKLGTPVELTIDQARKLARDALAQVREGRDPNDERRRRREAATMQDVADRYMREHGQRKRSGFNDEILWRRHLLPTFGRLPVAALTRERVREWHGAHLKPITANRALEVLGKAMELAEEWGWRPTGSNPTAGVKAHPERQRRRYMTSDELNRLRATLQDWEGLGGPLSLRWRFAQLVRLLLLTGARLREVMEAQWAWVDWDRRVIHVPAEHGKTGAGTVQLSDRAVDVLVALRQQQGPDCPWVIHGLSQAKPLVGYRKLWLALLQEAGITGLRVHDLRHTFASYALSGGETLGTVGQLLGHRSAQTTTRYAHLIDDAARRAVARLSDDLGV
jgi:integrase